MTRIGWAFLLAVLLIAGLFASMLSFGPVRSGGTVDEPPIEQPITSASPGRLAIPVAGYRADLLRSDWGEARDGGERAHRGIDLMAAGGTPVVAAAAGTVEKLFQSDAGGTTLYVRSPDGRWSYYYAHLAGYVAGMREGLRVRAGDPLGFVGDTGNAGAGNTHLHFGVSRMEPGDRWWQGEPVDPYPLLAGRPSRR